MIIEKEEYITILKSKEEYITILKSKPKVNLGGCKGCIERNGSISLYPITCPFPIMIVDKRDSHVCTCSRKEYGW